MDERYEQVFEGGDDLDFKARELFQKVPIKTFLNHLKEVERVVRTASWDLREWVRFKYEIIRDERLFKNIISWDGGGSTPFSVFKINTNLLKTSKECACVHFAIENIYMAPEFLPSIFDLLPEGWDMEDE